MTSNNMDMQNGICGKSDAESGDRNKDGQETETSGNTETFNLADPDELLTQLERVELTEEDTEELLNEAYKVNKKLRGILQKQVNTSKSRMKEAYSSASVANQRKGSSPTRQQGRRPVSQSSQKKGGEVHSKPKQSSASRSGKDKPTWDDRFSYT